MSLNILLVDDEKEIVELLALYLQNEEYHIIKCYNAAQALAAVEKNELDLALLDVMLPDMDGFTLCKTIREKHTFPIIMLTAKGEDTDRIHGLTIGADDYISKPFNPLEVMARVKAQLRRYKNYNEQTSDSIHEIGGLFINKDLYESMSAEQQAILQECAAEDLAYADQLSADKRAEYKQACLDGGMELVDIDRAAFRDALTDFYKSQFESKWTVTTYDEVMSFAK